MMKKSAQKIPRKKKTTPEETHQQKITQFWKKIEKNSEEKILEENEKIELTGRQENSKKIDKKTIAYKDKKIGKKNDIRENYNQENLNFDNITVEKLTVENLRKERNLNLDKKVTSDKNPLGEKKITVRERIEKIEREGKTETPARKISRKKISEKKILKNLTSRHASTTPSKVFKRANETKNPKSLLQNSMSKKKQKLILNTLEENGAGRSSSTKLANTNFLPPAGEPQLNHSLCSRSSQPANPRENRDQWGEERQNGPRQIDKTGKVAVSDWRRRSVFGQDRPIREEKTNELGKGEPDDLVNFSQFVLINDPEEA